MWHHYNTHLKLVNDQHLIEECSELRRILVRKLVQNRSINRLQVLSQSDLVSQPWENEQSERDLRMRSRSDIISANTNVEEMRARIYSRIHAGFVPVSSLTSASASVSLPVSVLVSTSNLVAAPTSVSPTSSVVQSASASISDSDSRVFNLTDTSRRRRRINIIDHDAVSNNANNINSNHPNSNNNIERTNEYEPNENIFLLQLPVLPALATLETNGSDHRTGDAISRFSPLDLQPI